MPAEHEGERRPLLSVESRRGRGRVGHTSETTEVSFLKTLAFCWPYIIPNTTRLRFFGAVSVMCTLGIKGCLLIPGLSMKYAVDSLASEDKNIRVGAIYGAVAYCLGRIGAALFGQGQDLSCEICGQQMSRMFSTQAYAHLQSMSLAYHIDKKTGETTSVLNRGTNAINLLMRVVLFQLAPTVLESFIVAAIFFKLGSPVVALSTFVTVVLYVLYTGYITKWRAQVQRDMREAQNKVSSKAVETIMNFSTVKEFAMEHVEVQRYDALRGIVQKVAVQTKNLLCMFSVGQNSLIQIGSCIGLVIAAKGAIDGSLTPGDFIMVQAYIGQLFGPLVWLGNSVGQIVDALANMEEVMSLFGTQSDVCDIEDAPDLLVDITPTGVAQGLGGDIAFEDVTFHYSSDTRGGNGGLKNVSFRVPAGKMTAICGPSGAGKSTIARLLLRLYNPETGSVKVNGHDIRRVSQNSLRSAIGLVAQETILFDETLRYNITYGKPSASDTDVWRALRTAELDKLVRSLPLGLDTVTGERGVRLSGGERQRVGIARAVLKNPGIMLLDESTSSLSTLDERTIQARLREMCKGRTTVSIAHRLSTIMMADQILVVADAEIVERGTHAELVAKDGGLYAKMWAAQTQMESVCYDDESK